MNIRTPTDVTGVQEENILIFICFPFKNFESSDDIRAIRSCLSLHPSVDSIMYNTLPLSHVCNIAKDLISMQHFQF